MLRIENLRFSYGKKRQVLKGLNLELEKGEVGVLLGANGAGKTTLFKNILGICKPAEGRITFDGEDLIKASVKRRAAVAAYVPQHIHFGGLRVRDAVLMGRVSRFGLRAGKEDFEVTERILFEMGLTPLSERNAETLSGGEKQKTAIARALAQEPMMLILDEPMGNLDMANTDLIIREAKRLAKEKGITVLSSLHDINRALSFGNKFFFMKDGIIKYSGGSEIVTPVLIKDVYGADVRVAEVFGEKVILGGVEDEN